MAMVSTSESFSLRKAWQAFLKMTVDSSSKLQIEKSFMYCLISSVARASGLPCATVLQTVAPALAMTPSRVLAYSLRFSLKASYSLYCDVERILSLTASGMRLESLNPSLVSVGAVFEETRAPLRYQLVSACILSSSSLVKRFSSLTFWYLCLTTSSCSGKVCLQADLTKLTNLPPLFCSSENVLMVRRKRKEPMVFNFMLLQQFLIVAKIWHPVYNNKAMS